jgi:hypothetical protein
LHALWTGFWFYAANRADLEITQWRTRESQNGRIFTCSRQDIGGYPFRLEVHCADPNAQLRSWQPPVGLAAKDSLVTVQVYDPTLVIGEFTGPLTIAEPGRPASMVANWTLAQASLRGRPSAPERLSVVLDNGKLAQGDGGTLTNVANAEHLELHGRLTGGSANNNPVVELGLRLTNGTAPVLQVLSQPDRRRRYVSHRVRLKDLAPKPWARAVTRAGAWRWADRDRAGQVHVQGDMAASAPVRSPSSAAGGSMVKSGSPSPGSSG